jgi:putative ABC transport system substrate-binding protein
VRLSVGVLATQLILLVLAGPLVLAAAQPPEKMPRVGYISPGSPSDPVRLRRFEAFREAMRELGYAEGRNLSIEPRWAEDQYDRYAALAADLVRLKVDVIVTLGGAATKAARQATQSIPIVMSIATDPLGGGLVSSLAHPGGNVTGTSMMAPDLVAKQLELLREVVPKVSRVAVLWNPANPGSAAQLREAEGVAKAMGLRLQALEARDQRDITHAFVAMARERAGALVVLADAIFINQRRRIADLAVKSRLPAVYGMGDYADVGGLIIYSANLPAIHRRAATFVDKILKGANPADLPVEQPNAFELVANLKTAKALGLTIPSSVLLRADQVME